MVTRPAEDVWEELQARCRRLQRTGTPVLTLQQEVPNWITAVEPTAIRRRSEAAHGPDTDSPVSRNDVVRVWEELRQRGHTSGTPAIRLTYALLARLIEGLAFEPRPFSLVVHDEDAANREWRSRLTGESQSSSGRAQLLDAIRKLRVYRAGGVPAPHKPLMLLLALAGYAKGTAKQQVSFAEIESQLRNLIGRFSTLSEEVEPQEPFWRLKTSGIWEIRVPSLTNVEAGGDSRDGSALYAIRAGMDLLASDPPPLQILRDSGVTGGFSDVIDGALWSNERLAEDALREVLRAHFPDHQRAEVLRAAGIPSQVALAKSADGREERAMPLHLLLRWQPTQNPNTITEHRELAEARGAVWWGKIGNQGRSPLSEANLETLRQQIAAGVPTHVYLYRAGELWRTDLQQVQLEVPADERDLIPQYYSPSTSHHLWLRLTNFVSLPASAAATGLVLASSGRPPSFAGQTSLFLVRENSSGQAVGPSRAEMRYFILNTGGERFTEKYNDTLGERLGFDARVVGRNLLLDAGRGQFIYYQTARADPSHGGAFIGAGRIADVQPDAPDDDGTERWTATLADYQSFAIPVSRKTYSPEKWSYQHGIAEIPREEFEQIVALGAGEVEPIVDFTAESLIQAAADAGLSLDPSVCAALAAALKSGKHVILTGPPGTAKTTLAEVTARLARRAGLSRGYKLTTATADWTTYETIGGLSPAKSGHQLVFRRGHFLDAAAQQKWLLIDELNRSNFDRAFGQMFTILSGQSVVLPYEDADSGKPIAVVVHDDSHYDEDEYGLIRIPVGWRIIATMNVFDKSLLFEMSFALMRRFAFIEVPAPGESVYRELWSPALTDLDPRVAADVDQVLNGLLSLRSIKQVGPAVFIDMARFAAEAAGPQLTREALAFQLFYSYLLPQFEGTDRSNGKKLYAAVAALVGDASRARLRQTLNDVLGLSLAATAPMGFDDEAEPSHTEPPVLE
jgi:MoxR-like ATPase